MDGLHNHYTYLNPPIGADVVSKLSNTETPRPERGREQVARYA